ncbi:MAG: MotA/TolQ/ExbB proton channel family protein, partial [Telluria sp.]
MFKNTRLSAMLAAVLFSVTAAGALVSAPAFADAPAAPATEAAAPAADAAAPAADAPAADAAAPAADAAAPAAEVAPGEKEEVHNPYGIEALWAEGDFVSKGTLIILSLMSMGSWYILITKLIDQAKIMKQSKETQAKFWKASSIAAGSATLAEGSPFRFIAETGTKATQHHDGALLEQIDLSTWV